MTEAPAAGGRPRRPRIVVADDSLLMCRIIESTLRAGGLDVVGVAHDGDEALALCRSLRPDAMTLDLHMPGTDGVAVLRALRAPGAPRVPVVVVSAFSPTQGARAVDALAEGAFELVAKPTIGVSPDVFAAELTDKLMHAAGRDAPTDTAPRAPKVMPAPPRATASGTGGGRLVVIACSTGGPRALADLLPALPAPLGGGTLIVQHMPAGFTASLATRLDRTSRLDVREATSGARIEPGVALLAPGGRHLRLIGEHTVELTDGPPVGNLRPRADLTIVDAARRWGPRLVLVVLTGMGKDGLEGAEAVRAHGGRVLAEHERTCAVYGMPRAVAEADLADVVLPLDELAVAIAEEAGA
jgi:two-component system, chemotaxis family, protein-glutamate methylesterase/glutaminase